MRPGILITWQRLSGGEKPDEKLQGNTSDQHVVKWTAFITSQELLNIRRPAPSNASACCLLLLLLKGTFLHTCKSRERGSSFLHLLSKMSSNCWQTFLTLTLFRACLQSCGGQYAVSVQHMNKDPCFCVPPGPSIWRPWDTSGFQPWQDQMGMVKSEKVNYISNKSWLLS